jgi:alkylhydroperoxidase family enzyme
MGDAGVDGRAGAVKIRAVDPLGSYLEKVKERAYAITDADVRAVKDAGVSEDEIFERTVAVAVEEGRRRIAAATRVIG